MIKLLTILISLIPLQKLKILLLKFIGIKISGKCYFGIFVIISSKNKEVINSTIESFNIISAEKISIKNTIIKKGNFINNLYKLELNEVFIGNLNKFISDKKHQKNQNSLIMRSSEVYNHNLFDVTSNILIEKVKIYNFNQFWTHGFDILRKINLGNIEIKNNVVINNNVIILPGVKISNNVNLSHGTVVHKDIETSGNYKSGLICKS